MDSQVYKTDEIVVEVIEEFFVNHNYNIIIIYLQHCVIGMYSYAPIDIIDY